MEIRAIKLYAKVKVKEAVKQVPYDCRRSSAYEAVFKLAKDEYIILYSFGVCCFINVAESEVAGLTKSLGESAVAKSDVVVQESYQVEFDPKRAILVEHDKAVLPAFNLEHVRMISLVVAQSVALEYFEVITEDMLEKSTAYSRLLESKGRYPTKSSELLKFVGFAVATRQYILSNLYISDNPEESWANPKTERLFNGMKDMFDIEQRYRSLNMSLTAIQESVQIVVDLLQVRKSHTLEWLIIILIAIEIAISLAKFL